MDLASLTAGSLSRLMLGTVQFGLPYGVANRTGQPSYAEIRAIVAAALDGGVNCFDTAAAYGSSEAVLGRVLHELGVADRVVVVTKVRPLTPVELVDSKLAARAIEESVAESRRRLRLDCLPVVLFHRETEAGHLDLLVRLKARGWLQYAGVSWTGASKPVAGLIDDVQVSALQLPGSVLDRRHQDRGVFRAAAARGVAVFTRSVYLQGLLLMPEDEIPTGLRAVVPVRRRVAAIADQAGLTLAELALRYMLAQAGVTSILTGVETVAQIRENLALVNRGPLAAELVTALDQAVPALPELILNPRLWLTEAAPPREPAEA